MGLEEDSERYTFAAGSNPFKIELSKGGDRFTVENSDQLTVAVTSLSKKEICLCTGAAGKKICATKKGKTVIRY